MAYPTDMIVPIKIAAGMVCGVIRRAWSILPMAPIIEPLANPIAAPLNLRDQLIDWLLFLLLYC